ncbi:MAG: GNAT family N-acetyltransferase [Acidobacteriota bacterium]|nr:GNAT family N-acetyltransferase [Acidobacteriota bacterium]
MHTTVIRQATFEDAETILDLITDLAIYEKEPHAVETTVEDIQRDGFGERPLFTCLIAELDGQPVGFSLYFLKWSTWRGRPSLHLEDLFVNPDVRGLGVGMKLLRRMARIALDNDCRRFEWEVLDWNMLARDFYHAIGAYHCEGWLPYRIEGEALEELAEGG